MKVHQPVFDKPAIVTLTTGNNDYLGMLEDHKAVHEAYCEKFDYQLIHDVTPCVETHGWDKLRYILALMERPAPPSHIFYLDADALIVDTNVDLRDALHPSQYFGIVVHPYPGYADAYHYNVGVMYWRTCPEAIALLEAALSKEGKPGISEEQHAINQVLHSNQFPHFRPLPTRWNWNVHNQVCDNPIVAAWHGYLDAAGRRQAMRDYMAGLAPVADDGTVEVSVLEAMERANAAATAGKVELADSLYKSVVDADRSQIDCSRQYAKFLCSINRTAEAIPYLQYVAAIEPRHSGTAILLANAHNQVGNISEAGYWYEVANKLAPNTNYFRWCQSMWLLGQRQYDAGWAGYQYGGWFRHSIGRAMRPAWNRYPQRLDGKNLYVCSEQGMGDAIFFSRWLPWLKQATGARITFETHEPLIPLFFGLIAEGAIDQLVALDPNYVFGGEHDEWISSGSLPYVLDMGDPTQEPYVSADDGLPDFGPRRVRQETEPLRIGYAWKGNAQHANDKYRSMKKSDMQPLFEIPGTEWVSLQYGHADVDITTTDKLAREILQCDLIVTVDTLLANLAGALGVNGAVMTAACPDWRWAHTGGSSDWYPTIYTARQEKLGDWSPVIDSVKAFVSRHSTLRI